MHKSAAKPIITGAVKKKAATASHQAAPRTRSRTVTTKASMGALTCRKFMTSLCWSVLRERSFRQPYCSRKPTAIANTGPHKANHLIAPDPGKHLHFSASICSWVQAAGRKPPTRRTATPAEIFRLEAFSAVSIGMGQEETKICLSEDSRDSMQMRDISQARRQPGNMLINTRETAKVVIPQNYTT